MVAFFLLTGVLVLAAGLVLGARSKKVLKPSSGLRERIEPAALALGLKLVRHDAGVCEFRGTRHGVETVLVAYAGVTNISAYPATPLPVDDTFRLERRPDKDKPTDSGDAVFDARVRVTSGGGWFSRALLDADTRHLLMHTVGAQREAQSDTVFFSATRERVFAIGAAETPERVLEIAHQAHEIATALGDAAADMAGRLAAIASSDTNPSVAARALMALNDHDPAAAAAQLDELKFAPHPLVRLAVAVVQRDLGAAGRAFASVQGEWADVSDLLSQLPLDDVTSTELIDAFGAAIHASDERLSTLLAVAPRTPSWLPVWDVARDLVADASVAARLGWSSWPEAVGQVDGGTALVASWLSRAPEHELGSYIDLLSDVGGRDDVAQLHAETERSDRSRRTRDAALGAIAAIQERLGDTGAGGLAVVETRDGQLSVATPGAAGANDAGRLSASEVGVELEVESTAS